MKKNIFSIFYLSSFISITAFLLFGLASCVKDYFDVDKIADSKWTPKIALPMVYSTLTINEIIKMSKSEGHFQIGSDNFVTLVYAGNIFSLRADERIQLPDNSNSQDVFVPAPDFPVISAGGTASFNSSQTINFNTDTGGQTQIDSLIYKSGTLDITVNSNVQHNVQLVLTIPSLKKNGTSYSTTLPLNYNNSLPVTATSSLDLTDYIFDMTNGGATSNQFNIYYYITVNGIAGNSISSSDNINISTNFNQNKFDKIFGYIGQQLLSPNLDTISIGLFANAEQGTFTLVDAKIKIILSNSYGVPIKANFDVLEGYNPGIGTLPVIIDGAPSSLFQLPIPSPDISQIGQVLKDSFELTQPGNDNPVQLIEFKPKFFVYRVNSQSNPPPPFPQTQNFVIDSSKFAVDVEIYMPLHGTAQIFTVQDTFDFELPSGDELDSLLLRIYISNGFPMDVETQILFIEDTLTYAVIDSALSPLQNILVSAPIGGNGRATGAVEKTIDQWFDARKLNNISKAKKIFVRGRMWTANGGNSNIKIYSDYKLGVKIGAMAKLKQTVSFH